MIKVRVRQDDRVDPGRLDRQRRPVPVAQLLEALKEPAVDEDAPIAEIQQVFGAGDRAGGSKKR